MIFRRRFSVSLVTVVFALLAAITAALSTPVTYTSTTTLRVLTTKVGGIDYIEYDIDYTERLMETYVAIANSAPLKEELENHVYELPDVSVSIIPNTELINISATHKDPGLTQYSVTKLAEFLIQNSREVNETTDRPVNIYVVEPASIPSTPSSTSPWILIGLGSIAGLVGGIGLAFIYENLDTRIYTSHQVEDITGLSVLGEIPDDGLHEATISRVYDEASVHKEAFRRLRTNTFSRSQYSDFSSLLITSAVKKDGRSLVSANLAYSISTTKRDVLLIDADMRAPSLHKIFNVDNQRGLSNILSGQPGIEPSATSYPHLDLIPSGPSPENPVELLDSKYMGELIEQYTSKYSTLIIDSPSCLQVTDPAAISPNVDGVLLVLRVGWVRKEALLSSLSQLQSVGANLIGVVTNRSMRGATVSNHKNADALRNVWNRSKEAAFERMDKD